MRRKTITEDRSSHTEDKSSHETVQSGSSIPNPAGAARRKLLQTLGKSGGGAAVGSFLVSHWHTPILESVVLPAHAQLSPTDEPTQVGCPITVNLLLANESATGTYSITARVIDPIAATVETIGTTTGDASPLSFSASSFFSSGTYVAGYSIDIAGGTYTMDMTGSCCDASASDRRNSITEDAAFGVALAVADDGSCTFL